MAATTSPNGCSVLVGCFGFLAIVGLILLFLAGMEPAREPYSPAEYAAFLQQENAKGLSSGSRTVGGRAFWVDYLAGDHGILVMTVATGPASPRRYKGLSDALATQYHGHFPRHDRVSVVVEDYEQMKTVDTYFYNW